MAKFLTWLIAPLFCLWVHWDGLFTWFQADDFAFLGLHRDVSGWSSFWRVILTPSPQGTFRPWSERAFFLLFWRLFGLDALPYHTLVFLTQVASLLLLYRLVLRLTGSRIAAVLAPVLWTANAALAEVMGWTCGYNEILCGFFLLAALSLWMRFEETGQWHYYALQAVVFVFGFGVLEINIVYPAIAALWALLRGRRRLALLTLPLFALSLAFYALHAKIAPPQSSGPYAMHLDTTILATLFTYWKWEFVPVYWKDMPGYLPYLAVATILLLSAAVIVFVANEIRRRNLVPLFFTAWFFITLAPLLPLRDHHSEYYLAIPTLGMAVVLSLLVARYRFALAIAAVYLLAAVPATRAEEHFSFKRGAAVQNLVLGVKKAIELHPNKTILLTGISADLYGNAIVHRPFRVFTNNAVYLAPEMLAQSGVTDRDWPSISKFALQPGPTLQALQDEKLEVYSANGSRLQNITGLYGERARNTFSAAPPSHVDVGNALEAYLLGPGWYPLEGNYRWMKARASVRMSGPTRSGEKLILSGLCVKELVRNGPAAIAVYIDGVKLATTARITNAESFEREFPLPPEATGKPSINVELEVSPTFSDAAKTRDLSVVFGTLDIR